MVNFLSYGIIHTRGWTIPSLSELQKDLVIYEMNVRAFTADESSGVSPEHRGTYMGLIEKVISGGGSFNIKYLLISIVIISY